jgi:DNA polymerase elongation subunit (family B)
MKKEHSLMIQDYLKQNPDLKKYTLAKRIYDENTSVFTSIKQVRDRINYYTGSNGAKNRNQLSDKTMMRPKTNDTTNWKPFKEEITTDAKILILDIETAPIMAYVWGIWNVNVGMNQIKSDWFCLTWAAKWLFEDKVYSAKLTSREAKKQDDRRIIRGVWELLNEADIVIAHNGEKFDLPKLNQRFVIHKLNPPLPYQSIDTLKHIRRQFGFTSNRLDYVNKLLNLPRKTENEGFPLWEKCYAGDEKALKTMEDYNIGDVRILEETYLRIRAWIKPHPSVSLFILDEEQCHCPSCGSKDLKVIGKTYNTTVNRYEMFQCKNCGSTGRKRISSTTLKQRRKILMSTPK